MKLRRKIQSVTKRLPPQANALIGVALLIGCIGLSLQLFSHAATLASSAESENGTISSPAAVQNDSSASGGKSVKFGAAGTGACPVSTPKVPGGPDGFGGCFPGPGNTGVPAGTTLTTYTGSCSITSPVTIDAKIINCSDGLDIRAVNVVITRSKVNARIEVDTDENHTWSLTLTDSEVDVSAGANPDRAAISSGNLTILRANIHGGHNGLECQEHSSYCTMRDTWVHGQWQSPTGDTHLGGIAHFGEQVPCTGTATNGMTAVCFDIEHSSIICDAPVNQSGGGCTGDLNMIAHYGPLPGAFIYRNLLGANAGASYCSYGGEAPENGASRIVYQDNIFQRGTNNKCGAFGPITGFKFSAPGNLWTNNKWDDGTTLVCTAADDCL